VGGGGERGGEGVMEVGRRGNSAERGRGRGRSERGEGVRWKVKR